MPLLADENTPYLETPAERMRRLLGQNTQGVAPGIAGSSPSTRTAVPRSQLPAWVQQRLREQEAATPAAPQAVAPLRPLGPSADPRARADRLREILESPIRGTAPGIAGNPSLQPTTRAIPVSYADDPYFDDQIAQDDRAAYSPWTPSTYRTQRAEEQLWAAEPGVGVGGGTGTEGAYNDYVLDRQVWDYGLVPDVAASVNSGSAYVSNTPRMNARPAPNSNVRPTWVPDRLVEIFRRGEFDRQDLIYADRYSQGMQQRASLIAQLEESSDPRDLEQARALRAGAPMNAPLGFVDAAFDPLRAVGGQARHLVETGADRVDAGGDRIRSELDERIDRLAGVPEFLRWFGPTTSAPERTEELRRELQPYGFEFSDEFVEFNQNPEIRSRLQNGVVGWMTATDPRDPGVVRFWDGVTRQRDFLGENNPVREVVPGPLEDPAVWTTEWLADPVTLAEIAVGLLAPWSTPIRWGPVISDFAFDAIDELTD